MAVRYAWTLPRNDGLKQVHLAVLEFKVILAVLIRDFALERTGDRVKEFRAATTQAFVGDEAMMPLRVRHVGQQ